MLFSRGLSSYRLKARERERERKTRSTLNLEWSIPFSGGGDFRVHVRVFLGKQAAASEKQSSELTERIVALEEENGVIQVILGEWRFVSSVMAWWLTLLLVRFYLVKSFFWWWFQARLFFCVI